MQKKKTKHNMEKELRLHMKQKCAPRNVICAFHVLFYQLTAEEKLMHYPVTSLYSLDCQLSDKASKVCEKVI